MKFFNAHEKYRKLLNSYLSIININIIAKHSTRKKSSGGHFYSKLTYQNTRRKTNSVSFINKTIQTIKTIVTR